VSRAPVADVLRTAAHTDPIGTEAEAEMLAHRLYRLACPGGLPLKVRWSDTATRAFGTAAYMRLRGRAELMLSRPIWRAAPEHERREVIAHEIAHLVVFVDHYAKPAASNAGLEKGHGHRWRVAMVRLGYPYSASAKHTIHVPSRRPGTVEITCSCTTASITLDRLARCPLTVACRRCRQPYKAEGPVLVAWTLARGRLQVASNAASDTPESQLWKRAVGRAPGIAQAPARVLLEIAERLHDESDVRAACAKVTP
jgi:predicted SprT family Zn-dependent metalloprotease